MHSSTRNLPPGSLQHVEDLGNVLLQAQRDLDRVRQKLDSLPLEQQLTQSTSEDGAMISLKDILNRTQSNLRSKAEQVLRSIEQTKLDSLPTINSHEKQEIHEMKTSLALAAARPHVLVGDNEAQRHQHQIRSAVRPYNHRTVKERVANGRALQALAQPSKPENRDFLVEKYALPSAAPSANFPTRAVTQVHLKKLKSSPKVASPGYIHKYSTAPAPKVLPRIFRKDPKHFPAITADDTLSGILNLVNRGYIPSFVDVSQAFSQGPAPLRQGPAPVHNFHEQFNRTVAATGVDFPVSALKLDLADILSDPTKTDDLVRHPEADLPLPVKQLPKTRAMFQKEREDREYGLHRENYQNIPVTTFVPPIGPAVEADSKKEDPENLEIRDYDQLLDAYSLHQIIIRKGKTVTTTPEYQSFKRKYSYMWGHVQSILYLLEQAMTRYSVKKAIVNGQRLAALAEDDSREPTQKDLLMCLNLENDDQEMLLSKIPGFRFKGPRGNTNTFDIKINIEFPNMLTSLPVICTPEFLSLS
jgi:hypothetical protein